MPDDSRKPDSEHEDAAPMAETAPPDREANCIAAEEPSSLPHGSCAQSVSESRLVGSDDTLAVGSFAQSGPEKRSAGSDDTLAVGSMAGIGNDVTMDASAGTSHDLGELVTVAHEHYLIGEEIARGGMGRIVRARDLRMGRAIAIKELLSPSPALEKRFEREMRITARLQHPSIISVHESGRWPSGVAFYTMKHVEGRPLDKVIDSTTTLTERLALLPNVIDVADALAYAHDRKVIHRDLKPANVLVGDYGETVVIDWGLAKDLTDGQDDEVEGGENRGRDDDVPGLTILGEAMGTPAYMPPEQAKGQVVDERADVYALGAMLYHLLAGKIPYAGTKSAKEILDKVLTGPPRPLGELEPQVPTDLVTLVEKAMAREDGERYPSAKELAEELRRFEAGQLVGAHDYSAAALIKRWLKRRRTAVGVAGVMLVLLIVGSIASFARIARERDGANAERAKVEEKRAEVEGLLGFLIGDLRNKLEPIGQVDILDLVARKTDHYYQRHPIDWARPKEVESRAVAMDNMGDVLVAQGSHSAALDKYRSSLETRQRLAQQDPDNAGWQRSVAVSHSNIGHVFLSQTDFSGALEQHRISLAIRERLVEQEPNNTSWQQDLSGGYEAMGAALLANGDRDRALEKYRSSLAIRERLAQNNPNDVGSQRGLSIILEKVGEVLIAQGDLSAGRDTYEAALAITEQLCQRDSENTIWQRDLAIGYDKIGTVLVAQGDTNEALKRYQASLAIFELLTEKDPSNAGWQSEHSRSYFKMGTLLKNRGEKEAAEEFFGKCAESYAAHGSVIDDFCNAACCYALLGEADQAFHWLDKAADMGLHEDKWLDSDPDLASLKSDPRWKPLLQRVKDKQ